MDTHVPGIGNPETPEGRQRAYAAEDYAMRGEKCGDCGRWHGGKCPPEEPTTPAVAP